MRTTITKIIGLAVLFAGSAFAQLINPSTQVRWNALTYSGSPAATFTSCDPTPTSGNAGQPYLDISVTPNVEYVCGADGWAIRGTSLNGQNGPQTLLGDSTIAFTANGTNQITAHVIGVQPYAAGAAFANQYNYNFTTTASLAPVGTCASGATSCTFVSTVGFPPIGCGAFYQYSDNRCWTANNTTTGVLSGLTQFLGSTSANHVATNDGFIGIAQSSGFQTLTSTTGTVVFSNGWVEIGGSHPLAPYRIDQTLFVANGLNSPYQPIFAGNVTVGQGQTGTTASPIYSPSLTQLATSTYADLIGYNGGSSVTQTFVVHAATGAAYFSSLFSAGKAVCTSDGTNCLPKPYTYTNLTISAGTATGFNCSAGPSFTYAGASFGSGSTGVYTSTSVPSTVAGWSTGTLRVEVTNTGTQFQLSICNSTSTSVSYGAMGYNFTEIP